MKEVSLKDVKRAYTEWYCESCRISNEEPVSLSVYIHHMRGMEIDIRNIIEMLDAGRLPGFRQVKPLEEIEVLKKEESDFDTDGYLDSIREEVIKGCGVDGKLFDRGIQDIPTTDHSRECKGPQGK